MQITTETRSSHPYLPLLIILAQYQVKREPDMAAITISAVAESALFSRNFPLLFSHSLRGLPISFNPLKSRNRKNAAVKAQTLDFSGSFFESGFGSDDDPPSAPGSGIATLEDKEEPQCPPGLRQYETMAVLRPDMTEDERLALTQKYEEVTSRSQHVCLILLLTRLD